MTSAAADDAAVAGGGLAANLLAAPSSRTDDEFHTSRASAPEVTRGSSLPAPHLENIEQVNFSSPLHYEPQVQNNPITLDKTEQEKHDLYQGSQLRVPPHNLHSIRPVIAHSLQTTKPASWHNRSASSHYTTKSTLKSRLISSSATTIKSILQVIDHFGYPGSTDTSTQEFVTSKSPLGGERRSILSTIVPPVDIFKLSPKKQSEGTTRELPLANITQNVPPATKLLCCNNVSHSNRGTPKQEQLVHSKKNLRQTEGGSNKQLHGINPLVPNVSIANMSYSSKQDFYQYSLSWKSVDNNVTTKETLKAEIQGSQNAYAELNSTSSGHSMAHLAINQNNSVDNMYDSSEMSKALHASTSDSRPTEDALFFDGDSEYAPTPLALPLLGPDTSWSDSDRTEYVRRSVDSLPLNDPSRRKSVHENLIAEGNKSQVSSQKVSDNYIYFQDGDGNDETVKLKASLPERHIGGHDSGYATNSTRVLSFEKPSETTQRLDDLITEKPTAQMLVSYNGSSSVSEVPSERDISASIGGFNTGRLDRATDGVDGSIPEIANQFGTRAEHNERVRSSIVGEIGSMKMNAAGRDVTSTASSYHNYRGGVKGEQEVVRTDKFGHSVLVETVVEPGIAERKSSEVGSTTTRGVATAGRSEPSSLLEVEHMCRACSQVCHHTTAEVGSAGRVRCGCFRGYAIASDWQHCADVDECLVRDSVCQNGMCLNTLGSFTCLCRPGYQQLGSDCVDIDECAIGATCDQLCINLPGSYQCWCRRGFTLSTVNRRLCVDLDECSLGAALCAGSCLNTFGSFICRCPPGAALHTDGRTCIVKASESREHSPHIVLHRASTAQPPGEQKVLEFPTAHAGGSAHSALEKRKLHLETLHNVATLRSSTSWLKQNKRPAKAKPVQQTPVRRSNSEDQARDRAIHDERKGTGSEEMSPGSSIDGSSPVRGWGQVQGRGHHQLYGESWSSTERSSNNVESGKSGIGGTRNVDAPYFTETVGLNTDQQTEVPDIFHGNKFLSESHLETGIEQKRVRPLVKPLLTTGLPFQAVNPTTTQVSEVRLPKAIQQLQERLYQSTEVSASTGNRLPRTYSKRDKQRRTCVPPCRNGGTCDTGAGAGACVCAAGFRGRYCQLDRNECTEGGDPCGGHLCVNAWGSYRCLCPAGYRSSPAGTSCTRENARHDLHVANMVVEERRPAPPTLSPLGNITTVRHISSVAEIKKSGTSVTPVNLKMDSQEGAVGGLVENGSTSTQNIVHGNTSGSGFKIDGTHPAVLNSTSRYSSISKMPAYSFTLYTSSGSRATTFATTPAVTKEAVNSNPSGSDNSAKEPTKMTPAFFHQNITHTFAAMPKLYEHRFLNVSSVGPVRDVKSPAKSNTNLHNSVPLINSVSNKSSENSDASTLREQSTERTLIDSEIKVNFSNMDRNSNSSTTSNVYYNLSSYQPILVIADGRHLHASLNETTFESKKNISVIETTVQTDKSAEHNLTEKDFSGSEQETTVFYVGDRSSSDSGAVLTASKNTVLHTKRKLPEHTEIERLGTTLPSTDSKAQNLSMLPTVTQKVILVTEEEEEEEEDTPKLKMESQKIQKTDEIKFESIKNKKVRSSIEKINNKQTNRQEERSEDVGRARVAASRPPESRMFLLEPLPTPAPTAVGTLPPLPAVKAPPQPGADCFFKYRRIPSGQSFYKDATNCTTCVCRDSEVRCERRRCPAEPLPCERPVTGRCCRRCPRDCELATGDVLQPGEARAPPHDPCTLCHCDPNGRVECRPVECTAQCYHPRLAPGECCPACQGCQHGNRTYDDGQLFPHPSQPCTTCVCQRGNITCYAEACAAAGCSHPLPAVGAGAGAGDCCPRCLHCLLEGQRLLHGASLLLLTAANATCHNCSCQHGNVSCSPTPCGATSGCRLESGAVVAPGSQFWPAQDACTECRCREGGRATCRAADCPGPPCTHGLLLPGSCCLDCSKCDYQGELFEENQEFFMKTDACQSCSCAGGNVTCHDVCGDAAAVRLPGD